MSRLTAHATVDKPADENICELYELPRDGCYHCRTGHLPPRDQPEPKQNRRGDTLDDGATVIVTSFEARWGGWCANPDCDRHYRRGSWIHRTSDGNYYCSEC
jgi:hypothetical protein